MPLLVNDKPIKYEKDTVKSLTENIDWQKEEISVFEQSTATLTKDLSAQALVILQGECAVINGDRFDCIATPFATTCNMLFLLNKSKTKMLCSHLDGGVNKDQLKEIFKLFTKTELQKEGVSLYIIGGYNDEKSKSINITHTILSLLGNDKKFKNNLVYLRLLFTATLNTDYKTIKVGHKDEEKEVAIPKYQNIGYNLKENIFVNFKIKGKRIPHYTLRQAIIFDSSNKKETPLRVIYNCSDKKHVSNGAIINSFKWKCPDWVRNVLMMKMSDDKILQYFSTSPYCEHKYFAKDSRALFNFVASNNHKDVFKNGKPIYLETGYILKKRKQNKNNGSNGMITSNDDEDMDEEKSPK